MSIFFGCSLVMRIFGMLVVGDLYLVVVSFWLVVWLRNLLFWSCLSWSFLICMGWLRFWFFCIRWRCWFIMFRLLKLWVGFFVVIYCLIIIFILLISSWGLFLLGCLGRCVLGGLVFFLVIWRMMSWLVNILLLIFLLLSLMLLVVGFGCIG